MVHYIANAEREIYMKNGQICEPKLCTGCETCVQVCQRRCISMEESTEGFRYPRIDKDLCIICGLCKKNCPVNLTIQINPESSFYMGWHKDDAVRKNSSSGGFFTALATYVLDQEGVVFGATMEPETRKICHIMIQDKNALQQLRLSKYYQSEIRDTYYQAKHILKEKRMVLFTGTACQIAGLYQVCGMQEHLITMDVLCHGVTNKLVVDHYIKSQEDHFKKQIRRYYFRTKDEREGWQNGGGTRMKLLFIDDTTYIADKEEDTFFSGFNENYILRESCYYCKYCGTRRISDFTAADFWGVTSERASEEERTKGISLILANSLKARSMIKMLYNTLEICKIAPEEAIPFNRALIEPNFRPEKRDRFFAMLYSGKDYDWIIKRLQWKKYTKMRIKKILISIMGKSEFDRLKNAIKSR